MATATGAPPVIDNDGDGLIDGSITWLFKDNRAFDLTNSRSGTFSDARRVGGTSHKQCHWNGFRCSLRDNGAANQEIPGVEH